MATASSSSLVDALRQYRLVEPLQLEELQRLQARFPDPKGLAKECLQKGWLTAYQVNQLLQGKVQELVLGQYILLERLGEGGMGQVFKARHRNLGRIVAVKLIRKERLDNPNAIKRFQREVRAAAALSHPNIVLAYDADEIGGTHLLVMEYIDGATDLSRLVKQNGPLPVAQACEYIRQAALGLQHAFQRGMVHRDIKPANLLLTADGKTVKVLDMGLARLDQSATDDDKSSTMTQEGAVMGTPDFIAPEQALESHTVDIRADLYSLGCTFYYLLTGTVPFPGGTFIQKINKHQFEQPMALEIVQPEVPPVVARLVHKLMAKKPGDRYQTPAEVAAALAGVSQLVSESDKTLAEGRRVVAAPKGDTFNSVFANLGTNDTKAWVATPQRKAEKRRWLVLGVAGGSLLLVSLVALLVLSGEKKPPAKDRGHPVVAKVPSKKTPLPKVDDAWLKEVAAMPAEKQVEAVAAKLKELNEGFDGKVTHEIEDDAVTKLKFATENVTDISPVRALTGLKDLDCAGSLGKSILSDLSPLKELKLTYLRISSTNVDDLTPLKNMKLTTLFCNLTHVSDMSPLKGMPLTALVCGSTNLSDLSPLKGMKLTVLSIANCQVSDLSPLKGIPLTNLECVYTPVSDLSPLKGMPLVFLAFNNTNVLDLSPLQGVPTLRHLICHDTAVSDMSPLRGIPLTLLWCDFRPYRDTEILRSIKTLQTINNKPAAEFWKDVEQKHMAFEAWMKEVAAMPAENQVEAVAGKLKELNAGFDGKVTHKIEGDVVTELQFVTDHVTDISPVRALKGLSVLDCRGSAAGKGKLSDLWPLKGMPLTSLQCPFTAVTDLSPLKDMKLTNLYCHYTQVSDLSPLKGMPLTALACSATKVHDLSPLKGMPLTRLWCSTTKVSDLSPLKDMPLAHLNCSYTRVFNLPSLKDTKLTFLNCNGTLVADLSPLKDVPLTTLHCADTKVADLSALKELPLKQLWCDFKPYRDTEILRSIKTLQTINNKPTAEFWKEVKAKEKES